MALRFKIIMISINLQDKAFGVPALAGILKAVILDGDPEKLRPWPPNLTLRNFKFPIDSKCPSGQVTEF